MINKIRRGVWVLLCLYWFGGRRKAFVQVMEGLYTEPSGRRRGKGPFPDFPFFKLVFFVTLKGIPAPSGTPLWFSLELDARSC